MGLHKYFFRNRLIQARELERLSEAQKRSRKRASRVAKQNAERITALEEDLGYLGLLLGAMLEKLDAAGALKRADVQSILSELDGLDGVNDGRLNVEVLREYGQDEA